MITLPTTSRFRLALALCALVTSSLSAAVVSDFTQGIGTTSASHQFRGTQGEGWRNGWTTSTTSSTLDHSIDSDFDLVTTVTSTASSGSRTMLQRSYYSGPASETTLVDTTQAFTIAFEITFNDLTGFSASNDIFGIFDNLTNQSTSALGSITNSWAIQIAGDTKEISVGNGGKNNNVTYVGTGLTVSTGVTYSFALAIDPANREWTASITPSIGLTYTSDVLGFRSNAADLGTAGRYIHFNTLANGGGDSWQYQLSGVNITAIPEPSSAALLLGGLTLGFASVRRRR